MSLRAHLSLSDGSERFPLKSRIKPVHSPLLPSTMRSLSRERVFHASQTGARGRQAGERSLDGPFCKLEPTRCSLVFFLFLSRSLSYFPIQLFSGGETRRFNFGTVLLMCLISPFECGVYKSAGEGCLM